MAETIEYRGKTYKTKPANLIIFEGENWEVDNKNAGKDTVKLIATKLNAPETDPLTFTFPSYANLAEHLLSLLNSSHTQPKDWTYSIETI